EQSDLVVTLRTRPAAADDSNTSGFVEHYEWLPLASALIELRGGGDVAAVVSKLRAYCGLDDKTSRNGGSAAASDGKLNPHCLSVYALLVAEHKDTEADSLLYDAYREVVTSRHAEDASLIGLAEIEARRGQGDEAAKLLKRLVQRSTDNLSALQLAAESAARMGRFADAIDFRQQIAIANPSNSVNLLELARVTQAAGKTGEAVDRLLALVSERTTPNTVRAKTAEVIGEIAGSDKSQAERAIAVLDPRVAGGDAGAALARAAIAEAAGNSNDERSALSHINTGPLAAIAQLKIGILSVAAGHDPDALRAFEQALYLDPDGAITDAISFRVSGPRLRLIPLYTRVGRDLAAVRLAEDQGSGQRALKPVLNQA
ncbi:MAG: tetratricopeptide repeat protein, partial [Blastocatellia bacterium]